MRLRPACQCITWGDHLGDRLEEILPAVEAAKANGAFLAEVLGGIRSMR
jgi:hypothetical protein